MHLGLNIDKFLYEGRVSLVAIPGLGWFWGKGPVRIRLTLGMEKNKIIFSSKGEEVRM